MKHIKKVFALLLAAIICLSVVRTGVFVSFADTSFTEGDFRYTITSGNTVLVSGYLGTEINVKLPDHVGVRPVSGVYSRCFENSNVEAVTLPEGYSTVGSFAFSGCTQLREVNMPSTLMSIGVMAFSGCTALSGVDLSESQLQNLSFAAFSGCTALASVKLPGTLTSLGENAFAKCTSLNNVVLPQSFTILPDYVFAGCSSLTDIRLPEGLQLIGEGAFRNCTSLRSIDLPYTVTALKDYCFENDSLITDVFIPETVASIATNAFATMSENGDINISCYRGSYAAEFFAFSGARNLIIIDKLFGDVNLDGAFNINDSTAVQKHLAMVDVLNSYRQKNLADTDGDGMITINDATKIQRVIAGLETIG